MAPSAACECGAEEQTVDAVVLQCPIHRIPHGLHGLTVLDDQTIEWLLNTCPGSSATKHWIVTTRSNDEEEMILLSSCIKGCQHIAFRFCVYVLDDKLSETIEINILVRCA